MAALLSSTYCDILDHVVVIFANRPPQLVLTFQNTHTHTGGQTQARYRHVSRLGIQP